MKISQRFLLSLVLLSPVTWGASSDIHILVLGGSKTLDGAWKLLDTIKKKKIEDKIQLSTGYPIILESKKIQGLNSGFWIVSAGYCAVEDLPPVLAQLQPLFKGSYSKKVTGQKADCPKIVVSKDEYFDRFIIDDSCYSLWSEFGPHEKMWLGSLDDKEVYGISMQPQGSVSKGCNPSWKCELSDDWRLVIYRLEGADFAISGGAVLSDGSKQGLTADVSCKKSARFKHLQDIGLGKNVFPNLTWESGVPLVTMSGKKLTEKEVTIGSDGKIRLEKPAEDK